MQPSVFVSSTFVDLRHVRDHICKFIESVGYTPTLFEKGGIGFDWQKPIDESCYDAVAQSSIFVLIIGGRYGSPATDEVIKKAKRYNSVTRNEYNSARNCNIPIYIFVENQILNEYKTYLKNEGNNNIKYESVDNILVFDLIKDIYSQDSNNYINGFSDLDDITGVLKLQWANLMNMLIIERARRIKRNNVRVNSFKLFFYRTIRGLSVKQLANAVNVNEKIIRKFERVEVYRPGFDGYHDKYFPECEYQLLAKIEAALDCPGKLLAGKYDDFRASVVRHYCSKYPNRARLNGVFPFIPANTKAVVFDFDGTIARHARGLTTWEMIWESLGYSINECAELHRRFRSGDISHNEWCAITLEKFQQKRLNQGEFFKISSDLEILPGFVDVMDDLKRRGIKSYIVSGSVYGIIRERLGTNSHYFDNIKANDIVFDVTGEVIDIIGTRYDFQGKADFIRDVVLDLKCAPMDVLFVGNAGNDGWAANAGVRTLCVNPTSTDPDDPDVWTSNIRMMSNLTEILSYL